jgi:predicted MFS family arabinose efflux permease
MGPPMTLGEALYRHNVRYNTANQVLQTIGLNMVSPFLGILALKLGASSLEVGLLTSLPALAAVAATLPATGLLRRWRPQAAAAWLFLATRSFYLVLASIPLWAGPAAPAAIALAFGAMNLPGSAALIAWQDLMARVFPFARRGAAFAASNRWMAVAVTLTTLVAGWAIDRLGTPRGYEIVFTLAFGVGLGEVAALRRLIPPRREPVAAAPTVPLREILADRGYVRYVLLCMAWYVAWQTPWPLFTQYQVDVLGANNTWLGILSLTSNIGNFVAYTHWARRSARAGNVPSLGQACVGMALAPVAMALSQRLWELAAFNLVTNLFNAGVVLLLFNGLLETAPEHGRTTALALYGTVTSAAAAVAPLLGVAMLAACGYTGSFVIDAACRIAVGLAFIRTSRRAPALPARTLGT